MRDRHEPRSEFVEKLEWQVGLEMRRRNRALDDAPRWVLWSPMKTALAAVCLMLVSMGIGAGVVVMAYEAQGTEARDQLTASLGQRADLARQRLALAAEQLRTTEQRVNTGVATNTALLEGRFKVAEADAQLKLIVLQLEEVRLTAREPRGEISAPRVSGRDFVGERLRIEMSVPEAAIGLEQARLTEAATRFQVGMAASTDVNVSRGRLTELETALETFRKKIEIRQRFLGGVPPLLQGVPRLPVLSGVEAELRVLEAEADQRKKTLAPRVELARNEMDRIAAKVRVGLAQQVELTEATVRKLELETELTKAELELALVRRRIEEQRVGK